MRRAIYYELIGNSEIIRAVGSLLTAQLRREAISHNAKEQYCECETLQTLFATDRVS